MYAVIEPRRNERKTVILAGIWIKLQWQDYQWFFSLIESGDFYGAVDTTVSCTRTSEGEMLFLVRVLPQRQKAEECNIEDVVNFYVAGLKTHGYCQGLTTNIRDW